VRLIVVRHGETLYNVQSRFTGQSDISLSALGEQQAAALGKRLAAASLDAIAASDLRRARVTAQAIARYHELPVQEDAGLREIAFGVWEGSTYDEIMARDADLVQCWLSDPTIYAPPGGETVIQLRDRVVRALERWQACYPEATIVWAVHGGVIEVLLCHLLGVDLKLHWQFRHENASLTEIDLNGKNATLVRLNEVAHLHDPALPEAITHSDKKADRKK
jgi:alpha-ribazole phosphatase